MTDKKVIPIKAVWDNRLWVVATKELISKARKLFTHKQYDEKACDRCEYRPDRHCEVCDECPAFLGTVDLWKTERKGESETKWIGAPTGNRKKLKKWLGAVKITDKRPDIPMKRKLKFTGTLHKYQDIAVTKLIKKGYGVLKAPPRSGKTVMAVDAVCRIQKKTLILASQHDWLEQFLDTFLSMTNANEIAERVGHPVVGICTKPEDMKTLDVVLATYQSFIGKEGKSGQKRLKKIKNKFSVVMVDEVHKSSSPWFSHVLLEINAMFKLGLTGTYKRKNGSHKITKDVMGPVTVSTSVKTLVPTVQIVQTPANTKYNYKHWAYAMRFLNTHDERNELIVKHAIKDIKAGRSIVIPVGVVKHAHILVEAINLHFGREVAVAFTSKAAGNKNKRKEILDRARAYKIKCIVGTRQLVQTGINIPRWDTLYVVCPISNEPNFEQETSRIRTDVPGKKPPLIKHFMEEFGPSVGCMRTCLFQTYIKKKFHMTDDTKKAFMEYLNKKGSKKAGGSNFGGGLV